MKIIRSQRIFQITTLSYLRSVNCYLIPNKDKIVLIDTGLKKSAPNVIREIEKIGAKLTHIILTHAHVDQMDGLKEIASHFPKAKVCLSVREHNLIQNKRPYAFEAQQPIKGHFPDELPVKVDQLLKEGDMIDSLLIIETPGHTPGSLSILDERNGHLFCGDLLQTRGGISICGTNNNRSPLLKKETWDVATSISSAKKILRYQPELLAVSHGKMVDKPQSALLQAIDFAKQCLH